MQRRLLEALATGARLGVVPEDEATTVSGPRPLPDRLTPREADVLLEIAAGLSNGEIARTLYVSEATVKTHVNHLLAKTGMRDRAQLVGYAFRHKLAQP